MIKVGKVRGDGTAWIYDKAPPGASLYAVAGKVEQPTRADISARLRALAEEMEYLASCMDYYGGMAEWSRHGREIAGAGHIARQWADEIEASGERSERTPLAGRPTQTTG